MVSGVRNLNVVQLMVLAQGLLWRYSQAISWCYSHLNDWLGPEHPSKTAHLMKASTTSPVVVGISPWFLATQTLHSAAWVNSWTLNLAPGFPRGKDTRSARQRRYTRQKPQYFLWGSLRSDMTVCLPYSSGHIDQGWSSGGGDYTEVARRHGIIEDHLRAWLPQQQKWMSTPMEQTRNNS